MAANRQRADNPIMTLQIGMLLFPQITQLDLTGPIEMLHRVPDSAMHVVWKDTRPVQSASGLHLVPTTTLQDCPKLDVLLVPGGAGTADLITDAAIVDWVATQGRGARYVTAVCTGSLVLGAAGLLDGYEATTHWAYMDILPTFGARPVRKRVVADRNRITAGGVTAGIDFGLRLVAELAGESVAQAIQLALEYDPEPPYRSGHPDVAPPPVVERVRRLMEGRVNAQRAKAKEWAARREADRKR
jgi:cyclohexyl-isocyanide hydratase